MNNNESKSGIFKSISTNTTQKEKFFKVETVKNQSNKNKKTSPNNIIQKENKNFKEHPNGNIRQNSKEKLTKEEEKVNEKTNKYLNNHNHQQLLDENETFEVLKIQIDSIINHSKFINHNFQHFINTNNTNENELTDLIIIPLFSLGQKIQFLISSQPIADSLHKIDKKKANDIITLKNNLNIIKSSLQNDFSSNLCQIFDSLSLFYDKLGDFK